MKQRQEDYKKENKDELFFEELNKVLNTFQNTNIEKYTYPKFPVLFIVGVQRSGTTLLMQLMSSFFDINYPNNLIARFWEAPYIGAYLNSVLPHFGKTSFMSDLGYTKGINGPHEFGYFWKRWFPEIEVEEIDYSQLLKELAAWQDLNKKPIVFKNLVQVSNNIYLLSKIIRNSYFIYLSRDDFFTVQSTLISRKKLFGNIHEWFGVKPSNYSEIKKLKDPLDQVVNQIYYVRKEIEEQLDLILPARTFYLEYEKLIQDPVGVLNEISDRFGLKSKIKSSIKEDVQLFRGNKIKLDPDQAKRVKNLLKTIGKH